MKIVEKINAYRFDFYLTFIAITTSTWFFLPVSSPSIDVRFIVGSAFLLAIIWVYTYNKITDRTEDLLTQQDELITDSSLSIIARYHPILIVLSLLILLYFNLPIWPLLVYVVHGYVYSKPVYKHWRIKNITFLKNVWAALFTFLPVWFGLFVYFPPFQTGEFSISLTALASFLLFYIVAETVWDMPDIDGDKKAKVYTLPVVFGPQKTKLWCMLILCVALLLTPKMLVNYAIAFILFFYVLASGTELSRSRYHYMLYLVSFTIMCNLLWYSTLI